MTRENIRPSESQISHHYTCRACGAEVEVLSCYAPPDRCHCGNSLDFTGESYPADPGEWAEERDDYYSPWHDRA